MHCQTCNHDNRDTAKFCEACGSILALLCARCNTPLRQGARFCDACGQSVGAPASQKTVEPSVRRSEMGRPAPATYTPKHLADKILQSRSALEGERKQVTVLFADVKGSMELAEQLDPEEWHRILERFFAILTEGVHRFEGTVNQYTGDGIMALFGAPIAHEDHAQRACYAALHLRDELARYTTEVKREYGISFSTRMGINSGEVVVGSIGDDLRMDYTAQGHTVGLAQRMESLASPDSCYLTSATAALAGGYFALENLGEFRVKGVVEPVHVHRLIGVGTARTRFDISRAKGLSRFVGRTTDMRTLDDAVMQTAAGNGQVVGVVAEAGAGKSRLCFEFLESCRARGMRVYEGHAVAHGKNIPLLPILELFRAWFGITSQDDARSAREKIAGRMVVLDESLAETLPLLYDFLGVADPQRPAPAMNPEARQRQLFQVMRQVIRGASETQPMVTLIEDLHWIDAASGEFLAQMVDAQAGTRNLLLVNFRPEYRAEWMQTSWYRQIPLTPLGRDAIAELLADLLGTDPSLAPLPDAIHVRSAGNPFFAEEITQSLIESGQLQGSRGAYRLVASIDRLNVPATVQAVLAARIDRLPEREKRLLQTAAVIGRDFSEPLLEAVAELPTNDLKEALAVLRRAEFLHEQAIYPVVEYAFKHPLTQEVALGSQLKERRRAVHAVVARVIEQQEAAHLDEAAALLSHHCEEAGDTLAAARWHRRAAEWMQRSEFVSAAYHWGRVRMLVRGLPGDHDAAHMGITACNMLVGFGWRIGIALNDARAAMEEGRSLADVLNDASARVNLTMQFARNVCLSGDVATYISLTRENYPQARATGDAGLSAVAWMWMIDALAFAGQFEVVATQADAYLKQNRDDTQDMVKSMGLNPYDVVTFWRGAVLTWVGKLPYGLEELDRGVDLAYENGTPEVAGYNIMFAAEGCFRLGDAERTWKRASQLEDISRRLGEPINMVSHASRSFAYAHLAARRAQEAVAAARTAAELNLRAEQHYAGHSATVLAQALLQSGDHSAACTAAEDAISLCRHSLRTFYEAEAHGVHALALLRRDGAQARDVAEAALNSAAELIERCGGRTLSPSLSEWRAELAQVLGDETARRRLLQEAQLGFSDIGAPLQAERIRRELSA